jgi:diguanylate cyclase (GGDEF)-like protein
MDTLLMRLNFLSLATHSVVGRFFRQAFSLFIAFAALLTSILVAETLWLARNDLQKDLKIYQRTFEKSLAAALWAMDEEKLDSIARGIVEIPDIKGVRILEPSSGKLLIESGVFLDEASGNRLDLIHHFPIIHDEGFGAELVAKAEFHSAASQLFQRTKSQIFLILLLALFKTIAFWFIFMWIGRRLLGDPLTEMTNAIAVAATPHRLALSPATESAIEGTELAALRQAHDVLADQIASTQAELLRINAELEQRVADRTAALDAKRHEAERLATHDHLTGLPTMRLAADRLHIACGLARRAQRKVALLFIDLDGFKPVNDSFGHDVGDEVLCEVARRLAGSIRAEDTVARVGGDEFIAIVGNLADVEAAKSVATCIGGAVGLPFEVAGHVIHVGASIGIAMFPDDAEDFDGLRRGADQAMYQVKRSGKGSFAFARATTSTS